VPRWWPGPLTLHVVVLGVLLFAATLAKGPWDSDFYWHLLTGRFIAEGDFPRTDPYSFTWAGMPWTLHEWLGELLIYHLVETLGYTGAVIVFAFIPGIVVAILAFALHRLGLRTGAVMGATTLVALLVIPYVTLRPQALSWIMLALLVGGLLHLTPARARWTLLLVPLFVLWSNLHGLWVIGLIVLGAYAVMSLLGMTPMSAAKGWALALIPLAMLGTVFTPEGPSLLTYPLRYVDSADWGMENITEWQSPDFHDPAHIPLLIYMGAVAVFARWRVPWWMSLLAFMGVAMTLLALRNGPVTAILGAGALGMGIHAALTDWRGEPRTYGPRVARRRRVLEAFMAVVVAVAGLVILLPPDLDARIEASIERELPVQGVELLQERVPDGRIIAEYGWGGYLIGQMYDLGARVMVDGRNDMYDDAILIEYTTIQNADDGWDEIADRYDADALIFPPYRAITAGPAEDAGWCEAYRDENEVVYLRDCPG
jgi:hypothetical protein